MDSMDSSFIYTGKSMYPALRDLDRLIVLPSRLGEVRPGDVIVFGRRGADKRIAHRVVRLEAGGARTRGDNNPYDDPWTVRAGDLIGRAVGAERGGKTVRVYGGAVGAAYSRLVLLSKAADALLSRALGRTYRWLAGSRLSRQWLAPLFHPRVVSVRRPGGEERMLLIGGALIGRLGPGQDRWRIKRPYRLLVNEDALPGNGR